MDCCAIDFGTSNSAVALPQAARDAPLIALEDGLASMPTAVFYFTDADRDSWPADAVAGSASLAGAGALPRAYGRAALRAYIEGHRGRLLRSMKSSLGAALIDESTDLGNGDAVKLLDVVVGYLRHLRRLAEQAAGSSLTRVVVGRPVFFVDDDPVRDARAQQALETAARAAGFAEVRFQFEPIAAAFDYERRCTAEQRVLVADIGGGTSDFSLVRVGPRRMARAERHDDILASHGVHIAGTDFDRRIALDRIMPPLGHRGRGPAPADGGPAREVPSAVYFDLATWHLINTVYRPQRVAELRSMAGFYADAAQHRRLMQVVTERLGHDLAARAEAAKIETASAGSARIDLGRVEPGMATGLSEAQLVQAIDADLGRIVAAAGETVRRAGLAPAAIDALYFTGGSTALGALTERLAARFPAARLVQGDRLASVATGLGVFAARVFG